jgi:hypothetical protein
MTKGGDQSTKDVLATFINGPNTLWSSLAAAVLISLMLMAIRILNNGPGALAALVAIGAAALLMAFRGHLGRPQPGWYRRILQGLAVSALVVYLGSAVVVAISLGGHFVR